MKGQRQEPLSFFSVVEVVVLSVKCGQTWLEIPELGMWESHGRAVKAVTLVCMMDGLWEVRVSRRRGEPPWAEEQAAVIDAVSPAVLFTFSPPLRIFFFLSPLAVGRDTL